MTDLKNLKDYNNERIQGYLKLSSHAQTNFTPSGIECPECGTELLKNNDMVLSSYPPQQYVNCPNCKYKTSVVC